MPEPLYATCATIYADKGQGAVMEYIEQNHPEIIWSWCDPCDCLSPIDDNACLVCASEVDGEE